MEFSKPHNWETISETICPEMLIFGKQASWILFFQNILTNPIIPESSFLWRHTLVLYVDIAVHFTHGINPLGRRIISSFLFQGVRCDDEEDEGLADVSGHRSQRIP